MEKTVFQKIIDREIPAHIIYEDEKTIAFLDIFPKTTGHLLVVPKQPIQWIYDADIDDFAEYWKVAHILTHAVRKAFEPKYVSLQTFGFEVPHAHIHVVPFYELSDKWSRKKATTEELTETAEKIKQALNT